MDDDPKRISDEETITILIEPKRRRWSIGEIIFWTVSHVPGVLAIWCGIHTHNKGRVFFAKTQHWLSVDESLGLSWVIIGLGIGGLAYTGLFFWNRPLLKWLFYIIGGIVVAYGIWRSFFK